MLLNIFGSYGKKAYLCTRNQQGTLTEWLGSGLQNRVQQFESAGYLTTEASLMLAFFCFLMVRMEVGHDA